MERAGAQRSANALNGVRKTPLHVACRAHSGRTDASTETVEMLLLHCDVWAKDAQGRLPLHLVFMADDEEDVSSAFLGRCYAIIYAAQHNMAHLLKYAAQAIVPDKRVRSHCASVLPHQCNAHQENARVCLSRRQHAIAIACGGEAGRKH